LSSCYSIKLGVDQISIVVSQALGELIWIEGADETASDAMSLTESSQIPMIFFSYSHDDEKRRDTLKKKLKYLEVQGLATLWSDREIPPGQAWSSEIEEKLNSSIIVLFLITSSFMSSNFIYEKEMPQAIQNYEDKKTVCIPIILEDCDWESWPYMHLQALPEDARAITRWTRPDSAYKDIQVNIRKLLEQLADRTFIWRSMPKK
jgi:hypothetical protein